MRVVLAALAAVFFAVAAPAPAAHAQQATLSASDVQNISGTRWQGLASWHSGESKVWTLYFRPDGVLEYGYEGSSYDNGRWVQNDALISFHTNTYFALYSGVLTEQSFSGTMYNRRGWNGVFSFVRAN